MSNTFFQFKQFTIHQESTAMKVCTDSCLFGAWLAKQFSGQPSGSKMLDVGTGTGLLALMMAQKVDAQFLALDLDEAAVKQAGENVKRSPWASKIQVVQADIRQYGSGEKYDLIFSNPPFYEGSLLSPKQTKSLAHHDIGLTLTTLMNRLRPLLQKNGQIALLLPYRRLDECIQQIQAHGFFLQRLLRVRQTVTHDYFRIALIFGNGKSGFPLEEELYIKDALGEYSPQFKSLLGDYYLQ